MSMAGLTDVDWKIVKAIADNNMNMSKASEALYMSYNSVRYHTEKIRSITGLDPMKFDDLVKLTQVERMKTRLVITLEVNSPSGLALAVKEKLATLLERYGDTKVVSVEVKEKR